MGALGRAEHAAWLAVGKDDGAAAFAHQATAHALQLAEALQKGEPCAGPDCDATVEYKGVGRPARYCGKRCRDRAAYRASRQRKRGQGLSDE